MEERRSSTRVAIAEAADVDTVRDSRRKLDAAASAQQRKLGAIETALSGQVEALLAQIAEHDRMAAVREKELEADAARLHEQTEQIAHLQVQLDREQAEWEATRRRAAGEQQATLLKTQQELAAQRDEIEHADAELARRRGELEASERRHAAEVERLARDRQDFDEARRRVEAERDRLADERAKTKSQRKTIAQELRSQRAEQLAAFETQLAEIARQRDELAARSAEVARRADEVADEVAASTGDSAVQNETILRLHGELEERATRMDELQSRVADLQGQLAAAITHDRDANAMLAEVRAEHAAAMEAKVAELAALSAQLAEKAQAFESRSSEIAAQSRDLGAQAAAFESQTRELAEQRARLATAESRARELGDRLVERETLVAATVGECEALRVRIAALEADLARAAEAESAAIEAAKNAAEEAAKALSDAAAATAKANAAASAQSTAQNAASSAELTQIRQECESLEAKLQTVKAAASAEVEALRQERDAYATRLAAVEQRLQANKDDSSTTEDLERRFEMAMQDLREQKARNADLEERLSQARRMAPVTAASVGTFDWEAQKRRMLESLDEDFDSSNPQDKRDRLTIEDTIRITDEALAHKDHEIAELKQLLDNQSSSIGAVAVGAAAIAQMLDQDELVAQERERLRIAQDEWREKLRHAEVELSVERAKIARERSMLEERLQHFESERAAAGIQDTTGGKSDDSKDGGKQKRRWLSRLGIRDTDPNR